MIDIKSATQGLTQQQVKKYVNGITPVYFKNVLKGDNNDTDNRKCLSINGNDKSGITGNSHTTC